MVAKILEILSQRDGWCADFGVWDGFRFSNCPTLVINDKSNAVLLKNIISGISTCMTVLPAI
jgi:hypothetical protein